MAPDTAERRPRQGSGALDDAHGDGITATVHAGADFAAGLRRRREAALRLSPYGDGPADPLDDLAGLAVHDRAWCCPGMFGDNGQWQPHCGVAS